MSTKDDVTYDLEELMDKHGLTYILNILEEICYAKEDHVMSNWQDENLANLWAIRGKQIAAAILAIEQAE